MGAVRQVSRDDYDALALFLASFPGNTIPAPVWRARLEHWWDKNPAFTQATERGWLLTSDAASVGFLGNIPSRLKIGGKVETAFNATTWRILPPFRTHSLKLLGALLEAGRNAVVFNATPTREVTRILEAFAFKRFPEPVLGRSFFITSPRRLIFRGSRLGNMLGPLPPAIDLLPGAIMSLRSPKPPSGLEIRQVSKAEGDFDQLWYRTQDQYPHTNIRSAEFLNWYCFGNPLSRKVLLGCYRNDRLVGYMVCLDKVHGLRPLECVDLWTDQTEPEAARALLLGAIEFARRKGFGLLLVSHFNLSTRRACAGLPMLAQKVVSPPLYFRLPRQFQAAITLDTAYFVRGQGDYGL